MSSEDFSKLRCIINRQGEERCVHHFVHHLAEVQLRLEKLYLAESKRERSMSVMILIMEMAYLQVWFHIVRMIFDDKSYNESYKKFIKKEYEKYALY